MNARRASKVDGGATVRRVREEAGLSIEKLAARIGMSSRYVFNLENGLMVTPRVGDLAKIARACHVPHRVLMDAFTECAA